MPASAAPMVCVERGGIEEAIHLGHLAVVNVAGKLAASLGDPGHLTYYRSCAKPFQGLASLRTGIGLHFKLTPEHVAIICASHNGEPRHIEVVRDLLARTGISEDALQCGAHWPYYEPAAAQARRSMDAPLQVFNNCSGKHAGMLAAAKLLGSPLEGYLDPAHPVQARIRAVVAEFTGREAESTHYGIDGCSAPNPAIPLASMARSFAWLVASSDATAQSIVDAMTEHPYLVGGTDRFDTRLMEVTGGRLVAKGGAAGAHCTADRHSKLGLSIKLESGDGSWVPAAVISALVQLGWLEPAERQALSSFAEPELRNHRRTVVGSVRPMLHLG